MHSPVRLGVSPTIATPTGFFSQWFWGFISLYWNPELHDLSWSPVVSPGLSPQKCGTTQSASCCHATCLLCPSCPSPTHLMNVSSLTLWLSDLHSLFYWHFWVVFVSKFVVVLLLIVQGGKAYLPIPPTWPELPYCLILWIEFSVGHNQRVPNGWPINTGWQQYASWSDCLAQLVGST